MLRSTPIVQVQAQAANALPSPRAGERLRLNVRNTSGRSLDLVIAGIDARGNLQSVYPDELVGETNRFKRGTPDQPSVKRFDLPWLDAAGDARLLVMAVPATPYSAPRLFGVAYAQADGRKCACAVASRRRRAASGRCSRPCCAGAAAQRTAEPGHDGAVRDHGFLFFVSDFRR